jgi:hypothetical protein
MTPGFVALLVIWVAGTALALRQELRDRRRAPMGTAIAKRHWQ